MSISKRVHRGIRVFLAIFWLIAFSFLFYSMQARGVNPSILESTNELQVLETSESISFYPFDERSTAELIFFPGALVEPEAYAPLCRMVAEAGYRVTIVKVPFRMDAFDWQWEKVVERVEDVMAQRTDSTRWIIGGHSRGGKMAARLAGERPERFHGLLLVGTSHPRVIDLSHLEMDVVKVFGSEDGLASEAEVRAFARNLPSGSRFVRIDGGNHRQFGYYGWQPGDGRATIDREAQHKRTVEAIVEQLESVGR